VSKVERMPWRSSNRSHHCSVVSFSNPQSSIRF
jgi:hypothetical protein